MGAFNQEKVLVGVFSVIVKTDIWSELEAGDWRGPCTTLPISRQHNEAAPMQYCLNETPAQTGLSRYLLTPAQH